MSGETFAGNGAGNFLQWEDEEGEKYLKTPTVNFADLPSTSGLSGDLKEFGSILVYSVNPICASVVSLPYYGILITANERVATMLENHTQFARDVP
jgi:hypothetical protein